MNDMTMTAEAVAATPRMVSTAVPIAIPLARLVASAANVRKTGAGEGIAELAASIAAHGLRQNLNVKPTEADRYEVVAGGRRLKALRMLVKQKKLPKDATVPCIVMDDGEYAPEISLAENAVRLAMHPDDQFAAFQALVDGGMPVEDVAARFGVTPALVERRLKLAKVSPRLRALFRKGELSLEHVMAFAVSNDHAEQERVWRDLPEWTRDPEGIRAALTRQAVRFDTPLARFVGMEAYVAAGGAVMRDLFDDGCEGYAQDRVLLLALAGDKLDTQAATVKAEGWKWVKVDVERDWSVSYRRVFADPDTEAFRPEDMARAGAVVRIGRDGEPDIDRGLVHPDDVEREDEPSSTVAKADKGDLPTSLIEDLTAHRTAAVRWELVRNPAVALAATVHALAAPLIYGAGQTASALELRALNARPDLHVAEQTDCAAHQAMRDEEDRWRGQVPEDSSRFFGWCLQQTQDVLLELLAFSAASSTNGIRRKQDMPASARLAHADALAAALKLDIAVHWRPSVAGFYGRLTKAALINIVTEAKAPMAVSISAVKKSEAARYVAEAMATTPWLPVPLRAAQGSNEDALPDA